MSRDPEQEGTEIGRRFRCIHAAHFDSAYEIEREVGAPIRLDSGAPARTASPMNRITSVDRAYVLYVFAVWIEDAFTSLEAYTDNAEMVRSVFDKMDCGVGTVSVSRSRGRKAAVRGPAVFRNLCERIVANPVSPAAKAFASAFLREFTSRNGIRDLDDGRVISSGGIEFVFEGGLLKLALQRMLGEPSPHAAQAHAPGRAAPALTGRPREPNKGTAPRVIFAALRDAEGEPLSEESLSKLLISAGYDGGQVTSLIWRLRYRLGWENHIRNARDDDPDSKGWRWVDAPT